MRDGFCLECGDIAVLGQLCAELIIWCLSWPLHKRNAWNKISSKSQLLQIAWWVLGLTLWKLTSLSPETASPRLKKKDSETENAGPLVNQAVDLKTDSTTLYYSLHTEIFIPVYFYSITQKRLNLYALLHNSHNNSHRNHTNGIFYKNIFRSIDRSLHPAGRMSWIILRL